MEDKAIRAKELDWLIYDAVDLDDLSRRVEAAFRANGPGVVPLVLDHDDGWVTDSGDAALENARRELAEWEAATYALMDEVDELKHELREARDAEPDEAVP
jgi:hypothetical protein